MPPPGNRERLILTAISVVALLGLAWLAWSAVGWFGVGLLGLLVLFIAVRVDLEGNRPVGHQMTPSLYAGQYRSEMAAGPKDKASRLSERMAVIGSARLATLLGGLLVVVGFGCFILL